MKKFNHLFIASIGVLSITSSLYAIGLITILENAAFSLAAGMVHGALTYKKEKALQQKTMVISGAIIATTSAVKDYKDAIESVKGWQLLNPKYRNCKKNVKVVIYTIKGSPQLFEYNGASQDNAEKFLQDHKNNHVSDQKYMSIAFFLVRCGAYVAGDYVGRKLAHIINEP